MNDVFTEARFWAQVTTDAERTIICSPTNEVRCREWIDKAGLGHLLTLLVSPFAPDDAVYVLDHHALEAGNREAFAKPVRWWP